MNKEHLISYIEAMEAEKFEKLAKVLSDLEAQDIHALSKSLNMDTSKIDTAIPASWSNAMRQQGFEPKGIAWSYEKDKSFGEPINFHSRVLAELLKFSSDIFE